MFTLILIKLFVTDKKQEKILKININQMKGEKNKNFCFSIKSKCVVVYRRKKTKNKKKIVFQ